MKRVEKTGETDEAAVLEPNSLKTLENDDTGPYMNTVFSKPPMIAYKRNRNICYIITCDLRETKFTAQKRISQHLGYIRKNILRKLQDTILIYQDIQLPTLDFQFYSEETSYTLSSGQLYISLNILIITIKDFFIKKNIKKCY